MFTTKRSERSRDFKPGGLAAFNDPHKLDVNSLCVNGTTAKLIMPWMFSRSVKKEHATDRGYFKTVFVLNPSCRWRLLALRKRREARQKGEHYGWSFLPTKQVKSEIF